jgi:hypothetical protein
MIDANRSIFLNGFVLGLSKYSKNHLVIVSKFKVFNNYVLARIQVILVHL